jgi:hypothetical protein
MLGFHRILLAGAAALAGMHMTFPVASSGQEIAEGTPRPSFFNDVTNPLVGPPRGQEGHRAAPAGDAAANRQPGWDSLRVGLAPREKQDVNIVELAFQTKLARFLTDGNIPANPQRLAFFSQLPPGIAQEVSGWQGTLIDYKANDEGSVVVVRVAPDFMLMQSNQYVDEQYVIHDGRITFGGVVARSEGPLYVLGF